MAKGKVIDGWYFEGKRPNGWVKRGEGSYRLTISFKGSDGKTIVKKFTHRSDETAPTKIADELNAIRADYLEKAKAGELEEPEPSKLKNAEEMTFQEYVKECWIPQYASDLQNLSLRTSQETIRGLELRIFPFIGNVKIGEIKADHIRAIISAMKDNGLKMGTIKRYFAMVSGVMSWAFENEVISENPCRRIRLRSSDTKEMQVFTKDQVDTFLKALQLTYNRRTTRKESSGDWFEEVPVQTMYQAYFTIAVTSGLRRGEICALTWNDINFKEKTVRVSKSISKVEPIKDSEDRMQCSGLLLKGTKNKSSNRSVPITDQAVSYLKKWRVEEMMISASWGSNKNFDDNYIFVQMDTGLPLYPDSPSGKLKDIIRLYNDQKCTAEEEKLPLLHLHELRHTCATQWIQYGVPVNIVAKWLGHSKLSTTLDIYGNHDDESEGRKYAEMINGLYKKAV